MVAEATELLRTQVLMFVRRELGIWEQPLARGGVSIHCMDWTGLLDWTTGLTVLPLQIILCPVIASSVVYYLEARPYTM